MGLISVARGYIENCFTVLHARHMKLKVETEEHRFCH